MTEPVSHGRRAFQGSWFFPVFWLFERDSMDRILLIAAAVLLTGLFFPEKACAAGRLQDIAGEKKTVIVIDPGHGGENRGTIEGWEDEKRMTMTTALAMYEELLLYDNVEVYLTHTEDVDMSLKERAEFAKSVNADFLFSVHYNASANHELFGSEVWVSAFPPYNGYGYQFGYELLTDMRNMGLLVRGVKTRLGDSGEDYYGIIRQSVALDIPAAIIEHCHVDEGRDAVYCSDEAGLKQFGKMDATAVARYFGLRSNALNVDYSQHPLADADAAIPVRITGIDSTEPESCQVSLEDADYENYKLTLKVTATDSGSPLLYYSYSTDRGLTFSRREIWPDSDALTGEYADTFELEIPITPDTWPRVIVRAYNMYDLYTESECFTSERPFPAPEEEAALAEDPAPARAGIDPVEGISKKDQEGNLPLSELFKFCLITAGILLFLSIAAQAVAFRMHRKRRRQRRNDFGRSRNQHR